MVLESLIFPTKAEKRPWEMFFIGFLYSFVAIILALWIFSSQASLVMVFLTVFATLPIMYNTMKMEEKKDLSIDSTAELLSEHNKAISFFMFLFVGIVFSCIFSYILISILSTHLVLPSHITAGNLFRTQIETISNINNGVSGSFTANITVFTKIFFNNVFVLFFALIFSFIYGAGAIFILTWNATVIGAAAGSLAMSRLTTYFATSSVFNPLIYFQAFSIGVLRYAIHGIPEILAYFYGGLAGGIISVALARHHFTSRRFSNILLDASQLILIALAFLVLAAFLEVYITPILF